MPARLDKKQKKEGRNILPFLTGLVKDPNFWVLLACIVIFICAVMFAIHEAQIYFVYNRAGIL